MALNIDWSQVQSKEFSDYIQNILNQKLIENSNTYFLGGYVYVEDLYFGDEPPYIALTAIHELGKSFYNLNIR